MYRPSDEEALDVFVLFIKYILKLAKQEIMTDIPCSMTDQAWIQLGTITPLLGALSAKRTIDIIVMMMVRLNTPASLIFCFVGTWLFNARVNGIVVTSRCQPTPFKARLKGTRDVLSRSVTRSAAN